MRRDEIFLSLLLVGCFFVILGWMHSSFYFMQTRVEKKRYRKELPFVKRTFFYDAEKYVRNRYSKRRHETLYYERIVKLYRVIAFGMLALLIFTCAVLLLSLRIVTLNYAARVMCRVFEIVFLSMLGLFAYIVHRTR